VAGVVRRMNEVILRRARLVPGWVTTLGGYTITVCVTSQLGQLNSQSLKYTSFGSVKAGMPPLAGGRYNTV